MLYEEIKKDNLKAIKARDVDAKNAYGALLSAASYAIVESRAQDKEFTDADMAKVVNKVLKELDEEFDTYHNGNRPEAAAAVKRQISVIEKYRPATMSEDEIRTIIAALPDKSIKAVMAEFKGKYAGKADFSVVSKIARSFQQK